MVLRGSGSSLCGSLEDLEETESGETVLIRKPFIGEHIKLELFWSWKRWLVQKNQILTNVVMFVPIGVLVGWLWKWRGLWFATGLSFIVEILQFVTGRGLLEFDDVLHNMIGAVIGLMILMLILEGRKNYCLR